MGRISRTLTLDTRTRRLRLPREYLELHGLPPGASLRILPASRESRCVLTESQWAFLTAALEQVVPRSAGPDALERAREVKLDTQGRVVLPAASGFGTGHPRVRLKYTMDGGLLVLTRLGGPGTLPEEPQSPGAGAGIAGTSGLTASRTAGDRHSSGRTRPGGSTRLEEDRPDGLSPPGPVRTVELKDIKGVDPALPPPEPDPDLAERVAEEGMRDPVVLHGPRPHRVIDGWRRIRVALYLEMESIPAVVLSRQGRRDVQALRYLIDTRTDRWALARQMVTLERLFRDGTPIHVLARLVRRKPRTVQRYLRVAVHRDLVEAIERGELSLRDAEQQLRAR